jgi:hypothetical protein
MPIAVNISSNEYKRIRPQLEFVAANAGFNVDDADAVLRAYDTMFVEVRAACALKVSVLL